MLTNVAARYQEKRSQHWSSGSFASRGSCLSVATFLTVQPIQERHRQSTGRSPDATRISRPANTRDLPTVIRKGERCDWSGKRSSMRIGRSQHRDRLWYVDVSCSCLHNHRDENGSVCVFSIQCPGDGENGSTSLVKYVRQRGP